MEPTAQSPPSDLNGLVEKYWRQIYKLCLFYLRDPQDAEDAAQHVFETILKKRSQFQGQSDPYTWIYRIAVNTVLDLLRRRKVIHWLGLDQVGDPRAPMVSDPAVEMERHEDEREKLDRLQKGIDLMSAREKKAFYFFYYEQIPQKEIAAIMGASVPAVEALVHKAVNKIRAA